MKIANIIADYSEFKNGCFFDRIYQPAEKLKENGHEVQNVFLKGRVPDEMVEWPDIAVFMRWYGELEALPLLNRFKEEGVKIVYEIDDDLWTVPDVNPTKDISRRNKRQVEELAGQADMVTTTTPLLKERLEDKLGHENVKVASNAVNWDKYKQDKDNDVPVIGWSGSVTHWEDLNLILPAIKELQEDYDFKFFLQGICSQPLDAEYYDYILRNNLGIGENYIDEALKAKQQLQKIEFDHIPFYPPEMHADIMKDLNLDIGLCPLTDNYFNKAKSNMKFYQYAALGATTIASDVKPYNTEMDNVVENTKEAWKEKIAELLEKEEKRKEILKEQREFVKNNRTIKVVVPQTWEKYFKKLVN